MKIVAHYKNEQLQTKGLKALSIYRPKKQNENGLPILSIKITVVDDIVNVIVNVIVNELKRTSKPFLIEKKMR